MYTSRHVFRRAVDPILVDFGRVHGGWHVGIIPDPSIGRLRAFSDLPAASGGYAPYHKTRRSKAKTGAAPAHDARQA